GQDEVELFDVTAFVYDAEDRFVERIDAKKAELASDFWRLQDVLIATHDEYARPLDEYFLPTNLTFEQIHDSLASPETISFWSLPGFIQTLKEAGFSALRHRLYWHMTLVSPLLFAAMVLIAAIFSFSLPRKGQSGLLITASIITGFLIYFLTNLVSTFGLSGSIPVPLAAWIPVIIALLAGAGSVLHLEDG
ncbi:MAG: LptF/LptG family permease, partial [Rickettsiales bacterium]|nr:LptF/LptG family permease [Rickettsiales bacterium]